MAVDQSLAFQQLSTVQNKGMPTPQTIASAATIAPTGFITFVSGAAAVVNITPPIDGQHFLVFIPTGAWTTTAAGNIVNALAANVANVPVLAFYNPITAKYTMAKLALTAV
jgi:hypothetical protein